MQPESSAQPRARSGDVNNHECPNCHALMPREMRFCRACGYRMGEGIEEYTETALLDKGAKARPAQAASAQQQSSKANPFQAGAWGAVATSAGQQASMNASHLTTNNLVGPQGRRKRRGRKLHWMVWLIFAIIMASVVAGGISIPFIARQGFRDGAATASLSKVGVNAFESAGGGAAFDYVTPPGAPADKAGLLGGDIIISLDGKPVKNASDAKSILRTTPIGKTIEVVFIRDGQTKTTQLTTISQAEMDRLESAYRSRPEGKGFIGEGTDIDRVIVPGLNVYGARLNEIDKNSPADMAGLKDGDIVIEFDGLPMRTRRELEQRIVRAMPYSIVKFIVIRNGERVEVPVKIGIDR